jgi:hypothetical protein
MSDITETPETPEAKPRNRGWFVKGDPRRSVGGSRRKTADGKSLTSLAREHTEEGLTDESTARANGDSALASRTSALEATVNDPTTGLAKANAKISDESTARANADSALSSRTSALEASVNDPNTGLAKVNAKVGDEATARANADGALASRTSTLEAQMAGSTGSQLSALISNEQTARVNADQALSNRVATVEANTGNGNINARVTTVESAVASLNGKTAAYFQVQSVAGNNRAELNIHADANGGAGIDLIGDVHIAGNATIDGNVIIGGTVTTPTLAPNTASQIYYAQSTSTVTISTNVEATAIYVDSKKSYADTVMKIEGIIRVFSPDDAQGQYNMYRDSTLIDGMYVYQVGHGSNYNTTISFVHVDADSGTGSRRYKITYIPKDNDVSSQQIVTGTSIIVTEVKR